MTGARLAAAASSCALLWLAGAGAVGAQASPWLADGHWSRGVAVRLHALGATPPGFDAAARVHTVAATAAALAGCGAAAPRAFDGCAARLASERGGGSAWFELAGAYALRDGAMLGGGFTPARVWTGPRALDDARAAGIRARADAVLLSRLALSASTAAGAAGMRIEQANAELRLGRIGVWGGRRIIGYAPGLGGGLVLNGVVPVDGGGIRIAEAVELAWLGAFSAELFAGVADSSGHVARPWLLGMRAHAQPHARFDLGVTRAAVFGALRAARVGVRQVVEVFVGANPRGDYADDQVASLDARWRPPLGRVPLELYGEWGLHDIDLEVLVDMPAFTVGARVPAVPGFAQIGVTLEHTQIAAACCGNPPWYHHFELADGWTESGELRGHPLGGHGREWRASLDAALLDWRILVRADALARTRGAENLFAPDRAGGSTGVSLTLDTVLAQGAGFELYVAHENGSDWHETLAGLALRWHY